MRQTADHYLRDLGYELLLRAGEAQASAAKSGDAFEKGRQTAHYDVVSLMRQQARAFGLSDSAIGLKDVCPEDLLK